MGSPAWTPTRSSSPDPSTEPCMATAHDSAATGLVNDTMSPSPRLLISSPPDAATA